jgi:hypothetical protein
MPTELLISICRDVLQIKNHLFGHYFDSNIALRESIKLSGGSV